MQKISGVSPAKLCRQRSDLSDVSMVSVSSRSVLKTPSRRKSEVISSIVAPERLKTALKDKESKIEELLRGQPGRLLGASGEPLRAGKDILAAIRQLVEDDLKHLDDGGPRDVPS